MQKSYDIEVGGRTDLPLVAAFQEYELKEAHRNKNSADLADFLAEVSLAGGAEVIWHVEPCPEPPAEARVARG